MGWKVSTVLILISIVLGPVNTLLASNIDERIKFTGMILSAILQGLALASIYAGREEASGNIPEMF